MVNRRSRLGSLFRRSSLTLHPLDAAAVARSVDEGVLITRLALTMAAKNFIIVEALRENQAFDVESARVFVRSELIDLALEQVSYARRMQADSALLEGKKRKSGTQTDEVSDQLTLLTQRRVTYSALASELTRLRGEPGFVDEVVEAARETAWNDVRSNVESRLDRVAGSATEADYAQKRAGRMMALRHIDLQALGRNTPGRASPKLR
ncbi:hypothetical protein [Subtercola boreus]|uniref:Asparagine synthase n=1 Tax=Subtercola boreus TaxID=120213 RepID=A0A3E0W984_9MICO|nr:hypothetical protein [Subtercola boreus]RFA17905.1 hypothetical protein B7R24_14640 [Subtercola boreus]RFA18287.1 hypothetical protein B7R23_14675 [Subtercola boreus]RFA24817.1 hypothetical protein B7R25_14670 [Subtercola boreus]